VPELASAWASWEEFLAGIIAAKPDGSRSSEEPRADGSSAKLSLLFKG